MVKLSGSERQQLKPVCPVIVQQLQDLRMEIEIMHLEDCDRHFMAVDAACMLADVCRVLGLSEEDRNKVLGEAVRAILGD